MRKSIGAILAGIGCLSLARWRLLLARHQGHRRGDRIRFDVAIKGIRDSEKGKAPPGHNSMAISLFEQHCRLLGTIYFRALVSALSPPADYCPAREASTLYDTSSSLLLSLIDFCCRPLAADCRATFATPARPSRPMGDLPDDRCHARRSEVAGDASLAFAAKLPRLLDTEAILVAGRCRWSLRNTCRHHNLTARKPLVDQEPGL